jgi:hypothetical protein
MILCTAQPTRLKSPALPLVLQGSKAVDLRFQEWLSRQMGELAYHSWRASSPSDFIDVMRK